MLSGPLIIVPRNLIVSTNALLKRATITIGIKTSDSEQSYRDNIRTTRSKNIAPLTDFKHTYTGVRRAHTCLKAAGKLSLKSHAFGD
jgi:hypothetical protein